MTGAERTGRALGGALAGLVDAPARVANQLAGTVTQRVFTCGCEIPPPCWEPKFIGTCCLDITPGGSAIIRIHVQNCDWANHVVTITAPGKLAAWLKFEPTTMVVGPQQSATFVVTVKVPDNIKIGQMLSGPLLIRGCIDHFARIEVRVTDCAGCTSCDLVAKDCPDHIHHWYDHFYCPRPCNPRTNRISTNG